MQAAATAEKISTENRPTPLPFRNDTMLGVCMGLGEEFGFNPNYLRVMIASLFLVDVKIAIGIYFALGIGLAIGRLLFRAPRQPVAGEAAAPAAAEANDPQPVPEKLAA